MSINATQLAIQNIINGLPMPGGAPNLVAYITPPDPNVLADVPTAYIWPSTGNESRNPAFGGTIPRAAFTGAPSGTKPVIHTLHIYLIWMQANDDVQADTWFPGMIDAIKDALRVYTDPLKTADPYTGTESYLIDIGERMTHQIAVSALEEQRMHRYDGLITCQLVELIFA